MEAKLSFRLATQNDLVCMVEMLSDDALGRLREDFRIPLPNSYQEAFARISRDPNQELTVVEHEGEVMATFQLTFLPYLTYQGGIRAQVEAVRVKSTYRGQGHGKEIFEYIISRARSKGAHLLQLTTDKKRPEAKKFYQVLGFKDSHEGMKLNLL